jgi:glycosyltransferase involved in cell wall biosynthesis
MIVSKNLDSAPSLLGGVDILTFANDWTADPTSKHHVMKHFSRTSNVLWVEAAGMRAPQFSSAYDRSRLWLKAKKMFRHSREVADRIHVLSPPAIPYPHLSFARLANAALYRYALRRETRHLGFTGRPLMCVFVPQTAPYIRRIPRRFMIYYCVDKWSAFEGFNAAAMERAEAELCRTSDLVLASAEDLADRCRQYSTNVHYIPHGVDHSHFARALGAGPIPDDLKSIPEPRVGFFGLIHEWVDTELIGQLADALPFSFVLIGSAKGDVSALERRKNVFILGRRNYAVLPDYCRGFQAAIVPFRVNDLTASVNPIKLREYAAAGLPVVSTALPEVLKCANIARAVTSFEDWKDALHHAVARGNVASERFAQSERVRGEDWSAVCGRIADLVNQKSR